MIAADIPRRPAMKKWYIMGLIVLTLSVALFLDWSLVRELSKKFPIETFREPSKMGIPMPLHSSTDGQSMSYLENAKKVLDEKTGQIWQLSRQERSPGLGPELTSGGVFKDKEEMIVFFVLPFPLNDLGRARVIVFHENCNAGLDILGTNDRYTVLATPPHDRDKPPEIYRKVMMALNLSKPPFALRDLYTPETLKAQLDILRTDHTVMPMYRSVELILSTLLRETNHPEFPRTAMEVIRNQFQSPELIQRVAGFLDVMEKNPSSNREEISDRLMAIELLQHHRDLRSVPALTKCLTDPAVQTQAQLALWAFAEKEDWQTWWTKKPGPGLRSLSEFIPGPEVLGLYGYLFKAKYYEHAVTGIPDNSRYPINIVSDEKHFDRIWALTCRNSEYQIDLGPGTRFGINPDHKFGPAAYTTYIFDAASGRLLYSTILPVHPSLKS
jgi:hypothetical protein